MLGAARGAPQERLTCVDRIQELPYLDGKPCRSLAGLLAGAASLCACRHMAHAMRGCPTRRATMNYADHEAEAIDSAQAIFKEAKIPTQDIVTDNRGKVAIVFERVNRLGVELDVLQLL